MDIKKVSFQKADAGYYCIDHPSGLTIYYFPTPDKSKSSAMIATKFGSINRDFKKYGSSEWMTVPDGIAHFLEHKLFEGEKGNAFDYYAKTGAKANAYTSNDRTAYYFVTSDNFYESLEILLQFVKHPYFTPENVEKEKGIIGQEIVMYDDEPSWQGYISLVQSLYVDHPVRIDIAGTKESIAKITDTMLYDCYNVFYNNSNLVLCIAGDLDVNKILEICNQRLPVEKGETIQQNIPAEPTEILFPYTEKSMDVSKPQFYIGIKDNLFQNANDWAKHELALKILLTALFGESSAFFKKLYQGGIINPEFSAEYEYGAGYAFLLFAGESDSPQAVREAICDICKSFEEDSISEQDFRRIRNAIYGDLIRSLDNAESVVNRFVSNYLHGGDVFSQLRAVLDIELSDVVSLGQRMLDPNMLAMSVILPRRK